MGPPINEDEEQSSVEKIKQQLYARNAQSKLHQRRKLKRASVEGVAREWKEDSYSELPKPEGGDVRAQQLAALREGRIPNDDSFAETLHTLQDSQPAKKARYRKQLTERVVRSLIIASAVFFLITGLVAAYTLFFSDNQVRCENVSIDIQGPTAVPSGKDLLLNVLITNNNSVPIEDAELTFAYPEGARNILNRNEKLQFKREYIGTIEPDSGVKATAQLILLGREQEQFVINHNLSFTISGSDGEWTCPAPFVVTLATSPLSIAVDALSEISTGQEMVLKVEISANSDEKVPNARLVATYPYGFTYVSADPKPTASNAIWDFGDITPGSTRTIEIRGIVSGFSSEARSVDFILGEGSPVDQAEHSTILQIVEHLFTMKEPFLETTLSFGRDDVRGVDFYVSPGDAVEGKLTWVNKLEEPLYDVSFETPLPDEMIVRPSVRVQQGFFRSTDNTMLWTPQTNEALKKIEPGQTGTLTFSFDTTPFEQFTSAINPQFNVAFDINARRISGTTPVEETVRGQAQRLVKFMSAVDLGVRAVYSVGPFTNTGPHPPTADTETTYTIYWTLKNTLNDVTGAQVIAELPINVSWIGTTLPKEEDVSFNPLTRTIIWNVDELYAGAGRTEQKREIAFQVGLTPSVTEVGSLPNLLNDVVFTGKDSFTGTEVRVPYDDDVDTELDDDPFFIDDLGLVRE
jgi:hypothetical protein